MTSQRWGRRGGACPAPRAETSVQPHSFSSGARSCQDTSPRGCCGHSATNACEAPAANPRERHGTRPAPGALHPHHVAQTPLSPARDTRGGGAGRASFAYSWAPRPPRAGPPRPRRSAPAAPEPAPPAPAGRQRERRGPQRTARTGHTGYEIRGAMSTDTGLVWKTFKSLTFACFLYATAI